MTLEWFELKVVLFAGLTALTVLAAIVFVVRRNGHRATRLVRRAGTPAGGRLHDS